MAACENPETKADLVMYFTVNLAFVNYFEGAIENLNTSISTNWTTQEQILPVLIESYKYDPKLFSTPKTIKRFGNPIQIQKRNEGKE